MAVFKKAVPKMVVLKIQIKAFKFLGYLIDMWGNPPPPPSLAFTILKFELVILVWKMVILEKNHVDKKSIKDNTNYGYSINFDHQSYLSKKYEILHFALQITELKALKVVVDC